jgi:hypothetical protein
MRIAEAWNHCERIAEMHAVGAAADAGFDGGEFSGPAHLRAESRQLDTTAREYGFRDYEALRDRAIDLGIVRYDS